MDWFYGILLEVVFPFLWLKLFCVSVDFVL